MPVLSLSWFPLTLVTVIVYAILYHQNDISEYSGSKKRTINMYVDMELMDQKKSSHP